MIEPSAPMVMPVLCLHLQQMVQERGYRRDSQTGLWLVKTCLAPTRSVLRDTCSKLVPIDSPECFSCYGRTFGPVTDHTIELTTCHYRCTRCKWVTRGCDITICGNCQGGKLTLLPPVINVDVYGWMLVPPVRAATETL